MKENKNLFINLGIIRTQISNLTVDKINQFLSHAKIKLKNPNYKDIKNIKIDSDTWDLLRLKFRF